MILGKEELETRIPICKFTNICVWKCAAKTLRFFYREHDDKVLDSVVSNFLTKTFCKVGYPFLSWFINPMSWFNTIIFHKHTFKKQHPQTLNMLVSDELTILYGCCSWGWHSFSMSSFSLPWVLPRTGCYRRNKAAIWRPATLKQLMINRFARNVLQNHLTWSMSWERNQFWRYHLGRSFSYKSTNIVLGAIPNYSRLRNLGVSKSYGYTVIPMIFVRPTAPPKQSLQSLALQEQIAGS